MELTAFDIETFDKIQKLCVPNKWYNFKNDRPDFASLCASVIKFSELYGIIEFQEHPDKFKYRIVLRENMVEKKLVESGFVKEIKRDDFYTKAYYPEILEKQLKLDSERERLVIPGTDSDISPIAAMILEKERKERESMTKSHSDRIERLRRFNEWKNK